MQTQPGKGGGAEKKNDLGANFQTLKKGEGVIFRGWGKYIFLQTHYKCCLIVVTVQVEWNFSTFFDNKF